MEFPDNELRVQRVEVIMTKRNELAHRIRNAKDDAEVARICYSYWEDYHTEQLNAEIADNDSVLNS